MRARCGPAPSREAVTVAALLGIVFGALGGRFALVVLIFLAALVAAGIWRGVALLNTLAEQGELVDHPDTVATVPMRTNGVTR